MLVTLLKGESSFEDVVEARLSEDSGVVDLEDVLPGLSVSDDIIHSGWDRDERCSFADCGAYIRKGC